MENKFKYSIGDRLVDKDRVIIFKSKVKHDSLEGAYDNYLLEVDYSKVASDLGLDLDENEDEVIDTISIVVNSISRQLNWMTRKVY